MKMYTQEELEQAVDEATTEQPATAEGWLEHYNGNLTKCAEALGVSVITLRKHRDNNTLSSILIYNGSVYMFKNIVGAVKSTPSEHEWDLIPAGEASRLMTVNRNFERVLKPDVKITRDPSTGKVQYWRKKDV